MATIANLIIGISADAGKFNKELDATRKQIERFKDIGGVAGNLLGSKNSLDLLGNIAGQVKGIHPAVDLASSSVSVFLNGLQGVATQMKELKQEADKFGTTVNTMFELSRTKGGDSLIAGLGKLQQQLGEAQRGSDEARKKFEALGLSWRNMLDMDASEQLRAVADRVKLAGTASERTAIAMELMGKTGREAVGVLSQGRAGLDKGAARAHMIVSKEDIENADRFSDAWKKVGLVWDDLWIKVAAIGQDWDDAFLTAEELAKAKEKFNPPKAAAEIVTPQGADNMGSRLLGDIAAAADMVAGVAKLNKEFDHQKQVLLLGADAAKVWQEAVKNGAPQEAVDELNAKLKENEAIQQRLADEKAIGGVFKNLSDQLTDIGGNVGDKAIAKLLQLGATVEQLDAADAGFALLQKLKTIESLKLGGLPQANIVGSSGAISAMNRFQNERTTQGLADRMLEEIKKEAVEQNEKLADILDELKDPKIKRADI